MAYFFGRMSDKEGLLIWLICCISISRKTGWITADSSALGMVVDSMARLIFYSDLNTAKIVVCTMDSAASSFLEIKGLNGASTLAVDELHTTIYWSENSKIASAFYDGSNARDIITTGLNYPTAIALDIPGGRIFWADKLTYHIEVAFLNGSGRKLIMADSNTDLNGLALYQNTLFYTDYNSRSVMQIQTDGTRKVSAFGPPVFRGLRTINIYTESQGPKVSSRRVEGTISGLINNSTIDNVRMNSSIDTSTGRSAVTFYPVHPRLMESLPVVISEICDVIGWMDILQEKIKELAITGVTFTRNITIRYQEGHKVTIRQTFTGATRDVLDVDTTITGTVPSIESNGLMSMLEDTTDLYNQTSPGAVESVVERRNKFGNTYIESLTRRVVKFDGIGEVKRDTFNLTISSVVLVLDKDKHEVRLVATRATTVEGLSDATKPTSVKTVHTNETDSKKSLITVLVYVVAGGVTGIIVTALVIVIIVCIKKRPVGNCNVVPVQDENHMRHDAGQVNVEIQGHGDDDTRHQVQHRLEELASDDCDGHRGMKHWCC